MSVEIITTIISSISAVFVGVVAWLMKRFIREYDLKLEKHTESIEEVFECNQGVADRVLKIEQQLPTMNLRSSEMDNKIEKFSNEFAKRQTEILEKISQLVSKENIAEIKTDIKELSKQLNDYLIKNGTDNIRMNNFEKAQDELFRIINNQKI